MKITEETTLEQFIREYGLQNRSYMIDPMQEIDINSPEDITAAEAVRHITRGRNFAQLKLSEILCVLPDWKIPPIVKGLQFLAGRLEQEKVIYDIWEDERKQKTGLSAFCTGKKSRFVLICPGGGYQNVCSIAEGFPMAMELDRLGYSSFVLQYRTAENGRQPAPQEDIARAVRFILDHADEFRVEKDGYAVMGFSAGGHLAASFGAESLGWKKYGLPRPAALMLGYPVITMGEKTHEGSRRMLLGAEHENDEKLRRMYSIELQVTDQYPPAYVWQCEADAAVPVDNSRMFVKALQDRKIPCEYELFPGSAHGWGLGTGTASEGWTQRAVSFWEDRVRQ